jgi:hypothetical protein
MNGSIRLLYKKLFNRIDELKFILPDYIRFLLTNRIENNKKSIVFVGTILHGRIARIAKWVSRSTDFELILICGEVGFSKKFLNPSFTKVYTYRNEWHLKSILKKLDGKDVIFHSFGPPFQAANVVVRLARLGKVLFDFQDLNITNYGFNPPFSYMKKDIELEEYVLKNVDGLVCHSLELQSAKKYYGEIKAKKLLFPNYTDNDHFFKNKKKTIDFNNLHLVYVGGVMSAYRNSDHYGIMQLHWLVKKLNEQRIHLHIYPSPSQLKEHIIDFVEFDKKLEYFHLHDSVNQSDLSEELGKYDFGILPFFNRTNKRLKDKQYYSTTLKMFNYFEASLPIITSEDVVFQNYFGRKYGGVVETKWEDYDHLKVKLNEVNYSLMVENIEEKRIGLSLENQIEKLVKFYNEI